MSKITLNIVEPGSSTPVDPGINPAVPNTGLFTHAIGGPEATIITVSIVAVLAVVAAVLYYRKKHNKKSKLTDVINVVKSKKQLSIPLATLAMVVSLGTLAGLLVNAGKSNTNAAEGDTENSLTVTESSEELTIEVADSPVFAVLPVEVTVEEATAAGYTLTAYTDSTDLVSTTNPDNAIPMIAVEGDELEALTDNTYGLALEEPTSKDDEVYTTLSTEQSNPTIIKSMPEYTPTAENDTTIIYYGFYITPDIPYGTYTNDSEVYYNATINTTPVTFDGNGLYFNEDEQQTTNEVEYIAVPEEGKEYTINQIISGEYKEPSQDLPYIFLGWSTDGTTTVPTYETEEKIAESLPISPNTPITLYAVWHKATTITFNGNGADSGTMDTQTIVAGTPQNLTPNAFTKDGYAFNGWNTKADGTGDTYPDQGTYTAPAASQYLTLYAQWKKNLPSMQDVATWGSALQIGDEVIAVDSRDDKEYTVARLADNNIWMTQNLDHNIVSTPNFYTYANTDIGHGSTPNPSATWTGTATRVTSDTAWTNSKIAPESYDPGILYWDGVIRTTDWGTLNDGTVTDPSDTPGGTHYHIGNYYNWTAAIAMSNSSDFVDDQQDANQSICPAGWRLPTYSGDKSYQNLVNEENITSGAEGNIQDSPAYFAYSGEWVGTSYDVGNFGEYWLSSARWNVYGYRLVFDFRNLLNPHGSMERNNGLTIRCVAR